MNGTPAALLLTVAAIAGAAGYLAFRHGGAAGGLQTAGAMTAPASATAAASAPAPAAAPSDAAAQPAAPAHPIPDLVPDVRLQDMAGKPRALRENGGRPRLYNFWATWCEPCRREIPLLNTLQARYAREHLEVVGIAVDFRESVQAFLGKTPLHYTLLVGEEDGLEAAQQFGMELALPFSVFADAQQRIVAVKVGELHRAEAEAILGRMRALREGTLTLAEARAAISADLKKQALQRATQSGPG